MQGLVSLLAGVVLCCLGIFLSLPAIASDVPGAPSALAGADGGANTPVPPPDGTYPLTPAEEDKETQRYPVNAYLLTMILLVAASFGESVLWLLMTNARRRRGAICSSGGDRPSLSTAPEGPSFLGVFRL